MKKASLQKVVQEIRRNNKFLITTHTSPEGDAIGSEIAFSRLLKKLRKRVMIVNQDPVPVEYDFFFQKEGISLLDKKSKSYDFDCMAVLDCSDLARAGEVSNVNYLSKPVINIDHHISNTNFGKANLVDPCSSCTCELIYCLYKEMSVEIDKISAMALYVGIMTDTGSFRYSNTSAFTHKAVADLMRFDIDVRSVYRNIYENIPFEDLRVFVKVLSGINISPDGKIAWAELPRRIIEHKIISFDLSDHILSFIRMIKGVQVALLFRRISEIKRNPC